jgi:hypothetical protein
VNGLAKSRRLTNARPIAIAAKEFKQPAKKLMAVQLR